MTINVEIPKVILNGNGTKTGYSFTFTVSGIDNFKVLYTPDGGTQSILSQNDYTFTPNPATPGGSITFLNITPSASDVIEIFRETEISQEIDFDAKKRVDYQDAQSSLDKLTKIAQELKELYENSIFIQSLIPDPTSQIVGRFPMTDGANGYIFSPIFQQPSGSTDANKAYVVDSSGKNLILVPVPGATNPAIPQPSSERREVVTESGTYQLGYQKPTFTAADANKLELWDGNKFIKSDGRGAGNPVIPQGGQDGTILTYTTANGYVLIDYNYVTTPASSGVISGLEVTKASPTTIDIAPGVLLEVDNTLDNPTSRKKNFNGEIGVSIPTTVGKSHFVYLNTDTMTVTVETTYQPLARGEKILLAEVEHTYNNEISQITLDFNLLSAVAAQLSQLQHYRPNETLNVFLEKASATTLKYSSGFFVGYNANANNDKLAAHEIAISAADPSSFRYRDALEADSALQSAINFNNLLLDDGQGNLSAVGNDDYAYYPVWMYPDGSLVIQYTREKYINVGDIPPIGEYLVKLDRSELAVRNASLIAVLLLRQGSDFDNDSIIFPIVSGQLGGTGGTPLPELPPLVSPADDGKVLSAQTGAVWNKSSYKIPVPVSGDENKIMYVTPSLDFGLQELSNDDPIARTVLNNSVLNGLQVSVLPSKTSLAFTAGNLIFMDDTEGQPQNLVLQSVPAIPQFDLTDISTQDFTYIYFAKGSNFPQELYTEPNWVRGDNLLFCRVDHSDNTQIDDVVYLYDTATSLIDQLHSLYRLTGNKVLNLEIGAQGTNSISHLGGTFYGYNANSNVSKNFPHEKVLPALNPITFEFRDSLGSDSASTTTFPTTPKVELTAGILTNLPADEFAYYPVWLYPNNLAIMQYATTKYVTDPPEPATFLLTLKEDKISRESAALVGLILWQGGKNFNTGSIFINISRGVASSAAGGSPLPPATAADVGRGYTVDSQGAPALGIKIQQALDGSDPQQLANTDIRYDSNGTSLISVDVSNEASWSPTAERSGDNLVVSRSGKLDTLTNRSEYVDPTIFSVRSMHHLTTQPWFAPLSKKGFLVSKMTRNDIPGADTYLRVADVFKSVDEAVWSDNQNKMWLDQSVDTPQNDYNKNYEKFFPVRAPYLNDLDPAPTSIKVIKDLEAIGAANSPVTGDIASRYRIASPNILGFSYSSPNVRPIIVDFSFSSPPSNYVNYVGSSAFPTNYCDGKVFSRCVMDLTSVDPSITFTLTAKNLLVTNNFASGTIPGITTDYKKFSFRFWTTSSTPIPAGKTRVVDFDLGNPPDTTNIPINLQTTFKSSDTTLYHTSSDDGSVSDNKFYFGFNLLPSIPPYGSGNPQIPAGSGISISGIRAEFELTMTKPNAQMESRYEFSSLSSLNTLSGSGVFDGELSDLRPGKITLFYHIQYPPDLPKSQSDFDADLKGILLNPFDFSDFPGIFLEKQTGSSLPTERIEFRKRKGISPLYETYDIECTPDEFTNFKIVMYFRNTLSGQAQRTIFNKLGVTIWAVNTEDLP
jgi:hypothetical protein